jgi:hypothetical protein
MKLKRTMILPNRLIILVYPLFQIIWIPALLPDSITFYPTLALGLSLDSNFLYYRNLTLEFQIKLDLMD